MIKVLHYLSLLCLTLPLTLSIGRSLHLKLMHRDSIHSPLYPGNLTDEEKLRRMHNFSIANAQSYETKLLRSDYNEERIHPRVRSDQIFYVVELTLGIQSQRGNQPNSYFFMMDSGSSLIWLQCKPCTNSWGDKLFDPEKSLTTFKPIPCNHPLCNLHESGWACIENKCHYTYGYLGSQATKGILATETFGFASDGHGLEFMKGMVFGCSHEIQDMHHFPPTIHGILGLDYEPLSLTSQIQQHVGGHQFAYCLPQSAHLGHLRFGHDANIQRHGMITIPFVPHCGVTDVYLPLMDVSIGNHPIGFAPHTFEARSVENSYYQGGFVFDSGAPYSCFMKGDTYQKVVSAFRAYFSQHKLPDPFKHYAGYDLCYVIPDGGFKEYPSMTFHFQNGKDFIVQPANVVMIVGRVFCVMIQPTEQMNLLGAYQQKDHWISFNYFRHQLSFVPADCSHHT